MDIFSPMVFPADDFFSYRVNEEFVEESKVVASLGGDPILVDHTGLTNGVFTARTGKLTGKAFYRGWMLDDAEYALMENGLRQKGITLRTSSADYARAYHLYGWYDEFSEYTPRSAWFGRGEEYLDKVVEEVGSGPYFVKDSVKSLKHDGLASSYAPDLGALPGVVDNFLTAQGDYARPVTVIRQFEEFRRDQGELRVWWVDGVPFMTPHPDTPDSFPVVDRGFIRDVGAVVKRFGCPFVTTDLAQRTDGSWRIVEVSDGQVSGFPKGVDSEGLYRLLLV